MDHPSIVNSIPFTVGKKTVELKCSLVDPDPVGSGINHFRSGSEHSPFCMSVNSTEKLENEFSVPYILYIVLVVC